MHFYDKFISWINRWFSEIPQVLVQLLVDDRRLLPIKAHSSDSGYDIRSAEKKTITIPSGETRVVSCGFAMALPPGFEAQIRPRSGLAAKHGITVLNSPGTIDEGYRGEIKVVLTNLGKDNFRVRYGDRIAQMVIARIPEVGIAQVEKLSGADRGADGFGSTGTN